MAEAAASNNIAPLNRREALYYIWTASMALMTAGTGGAILWFAFPRFREGEFGGRFTLPVSAVPGVDAPPLEEPAGRFWLVQTTTGVVALYKVCTHLGCLYKWAPLNNRFECPCHGSKYQKNGTKIEGPAPRSLDRFVIDFLDAEANVLASTVTGDVTSDPQAGAPVPLPPGAVTLSINTGQRVLGEPAEI